jgi:putative DNA primase/helicase
MTPTAAMCPREVVATYFEMGLCPVFWSMNGDSKGPKEKDWPAKAAAGGYTLSDYRDGDRVGILTGVEISPGKFLHDVDIDWGPGVEIAKAMLPVTRFVFGRASKPTSHCFYLTPEALTSIEFRDIDGTMLIELRGTKKDGTLGKQTMAVPSVWSKDGRREPLEFRVLAVPAFIAEVRLLPRRVCLAAIGMLLAKHLGHNGFGHEIRLAWAGFLLRAGLAAEDLITMGDAMSTYTNNREVGDVRTVVESTLAGLKDESKKVKGGPALASMLGKRGAEIIARINEWLGHSEGPQLIIRKASDVPDEKLDKQFGGRLVRGTFSLLAGPGEGGKGMFVVDTTARFTTGDPFPGETARRAPSNVIICATEDSLGRVKSRLRAAGADLSRVFFVEGPEVTRGGLTMASPMMLDDDVGKLVQFARENDVDACLLETVVEHFGDRQGKASRRSTNNEADVRSALSPFRAMCAAAGVYGLGAIHPRKSVEGSIDDSISGSAAFRNVTRAAHHIYRDPEDESTNPVRLLFTSKSNYLSRRPPTLRFRIRSWDEGIASPCMCPVSDCGHEGRIVWEDDLVDKRTAEDVWKQISQRGKPRRDVNVQEAEAFLAGLMHEGVIALTPEEIFKLASAEGITKAAVKRAKENMRLVSKKLGFPAAVVCWQVAGEEL